MEGEDYRRIIKVFHISLLYTPIGKGTLYHGKTIIHEIETKEKLTVRFKNKKTGAQYNAPDILPEYFIISVPGFNDRLEKEIDDWLYVMKYGKVPATFRSPYMKKIAEKLDVLKMTRAEHDEYLYYQKNIQDTNNREEEIRTEGVEEGVVKGIVIGKTESTQSIALNMLKENCDLKLIAKVTKLSLKEIKHLKP